MPTFARPIFHRIRPLGALLCLALAGASISRGHEVAVPLPKLLQQGLPAVNLSSPAEGAEPLMFRLVVPEGARRLVFRTTGGTGDCDLYARFGVHPSDEESDHQSLGVRNEETITILNPAAGPWFVLLKAEQPFSGVRLTANYHRPAGAAVAPRFFPAPGSFGGVARVQILSPVAGALIRYTTDGSEPGATSPRYTRPLFLTADTLVRARAFLRGKSDGPIVDAPYFVTPEDAPTPLANGLALQHRGGVAGRVALFKITVPANQAQLRVATSGGYGDSEIRVQHGAPPAKGVHTQRANGPRNRAELAIERPAPGEWFIELRALTRFAGCTLSASYRASLADLVAWAPTTQPHIVEQTFTASQCEVREGMITAGAHTLLRFATESRNIGGSDLVLPNPVGNPNFEFQECHGHYHFKGFARYRLLDAEGNVAAVGSKVSYCLLDVVRWDPAAAPRSKFSCDAQGIQAGWSDVYSSGLPGQWVVITGLAPGNYVLEITLNPDGLLEESDLTNNTTRVPVVIE